MQTIALHPDFIGTGKRLFHISLLADGWETPTLWLVAADTFEAATETAINEYADSFEAGDFKDGIGGYEIGVFI